MSARARKKPLPQGAISAHIESFAHDGRGVARVEGKAVFIDGALPGEDVTFVYTSVRRDYAEGKVEEVVTPAPGRVSPGCPSFGVCGGCSFQHLTDAAQIEEKQKLLVDQFRRIGKIDDVPLWPPLTGPHWGYRHKARLGVKYVPKKGRVLVGFRERSSPYIADLEFCPVLHPKVGERLRDLSELIGSLVIKDRLPQIEVAVGDERTALIFRILEDVPPDDLERLKAFGTRLDFDIYVQRHGPDSVIPHYPEHPPMLSYALPNQDIEFRFKPTDFTQVNVEINRKMVDRVMEVLDPAPGDAVLDLFCGIGNFTLPIAKRAGCVIGVEGSRESVERARQNADANSMGNVEFHVADLSQALNDADWASRRYDKILLDPSRAGAEEVLSYVPRWGASRIVYVSCNPSTLARDAGILVHQHGYRLIRAGVMDMFPQTAHVESIALFEKG
ncbi:23S rRNA (uracil(1939)-C(5))-methyltransferase RlmD [Methylocaldum sp.]|uniref:23S rRNA (uracil(1939)-C(5))-methyltransferase RlmD n=1 Tax=Methylocaldum sp. TaxID=1969727 RepID=UPI002D57864A|nr:23S rRNA (uracil(1939)-C(5))-methyltransferase RlmD [Methylocaldum sp.]HYE38060.1 23S rRNA (uracil(1939)-C(5))-methyltransferase RlmD [Methylocaldum sp.]